MKTTKTHRISLMTALKKCNEEIILAESIIEKEKQKITKDNNNSKDAISIFEIQLFLNEKQRDLIEKSLIDNEIDF